VGRNYKFFIVESGIGEKGIGAGGWRAGWLSIALSRLQNYFRVDGLRAGPARKQANV